VIEKKKKREKEEERRKEDVKAKVKYPKYLYNFILLGFCLSGMAALIYEVAWTRLLQLVFGTTVYAVSTMLTAFMAGLALGSWLVGRYTDRIKNHFLAFCLLEAGIGIYGILLIPIFSALPSVYLGLFHTFHSSFRVFSFFQFLLCFSVLIIPTTLMGGTFPVVSKIYTRRMEELGKDIGNIYSVNNLGAVLGSFSAGFLFIPFIGVRNTIIAAASLNIFVAILIAILSRERKGKGIIFMSSLCVILLLGIAMPGYSYDVKVLNTALYQRAGMYTSVEELRANLEDMRVLYYIEGLYGTVAVTESKSYGIRSLMLNGKADASTTREDMTTQLLLGYVPLILHENPKKVLIIGLGGGFTLGVAENFDDVEKIDVVEIDPLVVEAEKFFSTYNKNALDDERVNLVVADARNYLFTTDEKYDVIISEPSNPWISGACSNLFTKEFFELSKEHLNEGGIFLQWVPVYDVSVSDFKTLLNTFSKVYDHTMLWTATGEGDMLFMGSESEKPIEMNYSRLVKYLSKKEVMNDLEGIGIQSADDFLAKTFLMSKGETKGFVDGASINTDDKPVIEFFAPLSIHMHSNPDLFGEISRYKARVGTLLYVPPLKGLEIREGNVSRLAFMSLNVKLDEEWKGETFGVVVNKTYRKIEGGMVIDLGIWKEAEYHSSGACLKIYASTPPASPTRAQVANFLGTSPIELEQGMLGVGSYPAYFSYEGDGESESMTAVWFCEENSHLYIVEITHPEEMQEDMKGILSGFECVSSNFKKV
jgi:spermidine synthase